MELIKVLAFIGFGLAVGYKTKGKSADYWDGYRHGKSRARWEVAIVFAAIYFGIAAIGHYYA